MSNPKRGWESKQLAPNALAANILCRRHNTALSGLDVVGRDFVRAIRAVEATVQRGGRAVFNGLDVERWMLKVLCGMLATEDEPLPDAWGRMLFGLDDIRPPAGMHVNISVGDVVGEDLDSLRFDLARGRHENPEAVGLAMTLHGYRFLLGLDGIRVYDASELGKQSVLRPKHFHFRNAATRAGYRILLGWPGAEGDGVSFAWNPTPPPA